MLGYCSIGSDTSPIIPSRTMRIEITVESTGRLINVVKVIIVNYQFSIIHYFFIAPTMSPALIALACSLIFS